MKSRARHSKLKTQNSNSRTRPFVLLNLAMTADGKIASANRALHTFGSRRDLAHLYELRATADAVMCGARTVEETNATLGAGGAKYRRQRLRNGLATESLRVIVSGSGSVDPRAKIFQKPGAPLLILTTARAPKAQLARLQSLATAVKKFGRQEINFVAALRWLRTEWKVRRLLSEGGGELNDALFRAGLVDELHLTICPIIFGGRHAATPADGRGFDQLARAYAMRLHSWKRIGDELFLVFRKAGGKARGSRNAPG